MKAHASVAFGILSGLRDYNGQPFVLWLPVLPVLLAGISVLHIPVLRAIWILNAAVYGVTTALLVRHLSTTRDRLTLAVAAGLFVAVHPWFGYVHGRLWSESQFLLWTLLWSMSFPERCHSCPFSMGLP